MESVFRELLFSMRSLRRGPLVLTTAVLTLALGLGLSTGVFAVAYGVLLRPLPFEDPSRLVVIAMHRSAQPDAEIGVDLAGAQEWRLRARAFSAIAAHSSSEFTLRGAGEPRSVRAAMVMDGFFETFGVRPTAGRTDAIAGVNRAIAISARLAGQMGADPSWRDRGVSLGQDHFDVAAEMPPTFHFPSERIDLWVSADAVPKVSLFTSDDQRIFHLVARMAPGVSIQQARDDAARVAAELNEGLTEPRKRYATVKFLDDVLRADARATVVPFVAGSLLVVLIACANVSGLLVGRTAGREREFAVRRAIGGERSHVFRAALLESFAIALVGWALGLWIAHLVISGFSAFAADAVANLQAARLDFPVLAASLALTVLVALASGVAPALRAARIEPGELLKHGVERSGHTAGALRATLVVAQVALTLVLLVCSGLLARTVWNILGSERGFELEHGLATRIMLSDSVRFNVTDRAEYLDRLLADVRALPGVVSAGVGSDLPPRDAQMMMTIRIVTDQRSEIFPLTFAAVTPGYLESIGVRLVAGRLFEERDRSSNPPVVVVSQSAARMLFQERDPIGREWPASIPTAAGRVKPRVLGVVGDVKYGGLDRDARSAIFAPWEALAPSQAYLVVRAAGDPRALAPAVRRTVQRIDPSLPAYTPESLEEVVAGSIAERRLRLRLAVVFASLALLLASVALWGAVAQGVAERRRELAIRMALGSTDGAAVRLIVRRGAVLILLGVGAGLVAAGASAHFLRHLLHGVRPLDPLTFGIGVAIAGGLSLIACYAPARRAAAINPAELLRHG